MEEMTIRRLIEQAFRVRKRAYCPYSKFAVGAALLAMNGGIYTGCNVENAAYSPSNCAERTAFFKAVSEGVRDFCAIAVVGGPVHLAEHEMEICSPCGVCRQVMTEFCKEDFQIILAKSRDCYEIYTLAELVPHAFILS